MDDRSETTTALACPWCMEPLDPDWRETAVVCDSDIGGVAAHRGHYCPHCGDNIHFDGEMKADA